MSRKRYSKHIKWVKLSERTGNAEEMYLCGVRIYQQRIFGKKDVLQFLLALEPITECIKILSFPSGHMPRLLFPPAEDMQKAANEIWQIARELKWLDLRGLEDPFRQNDPSYIVQHFLDVGLQDERLEKIADLKSKLPGIEETVAELQQLVEHAERLVSEGKGLRALPEEWIGESATSIFRRILRVILLRIVGECVLIVLGVGMLAFIILR